MCVSDVQRRLAGWLVGGVTGQAARKQTHGGQHPCRNNWDMTERRQTRCHRASAHCPTYTQATPQLQSPRSSTAAAQPPAVRSTAKCAQPRAVRSTTGSTTSRQQYTQPPAVHLTTSTTTNHQQYNQPTPAPAGRRRTRGVRGV